jgi:hypothetical protein
MLRGQPTVFLSCSEKFRKQVALPVREALGQRGVHGVIVSEEPLLPRSAGDPDGKVESYMDAKEVCDVLPEVSDGERDPLSPFGM